MEKFKRKIMTLVSSKGFIANQENFFDLEPDEDFYRVLPAEEFRKNLVVVLENVDKKYASKNVN